MSDALPSLRTDAPPFELRALGLALDRLFREEPQAFSDLFEPLGARRGTTVNSVEIAHLLRTFGLAYGDQALFGLHRIRRRGDRFYVMELGGVAEYRQDIWPETDAMLDVLESAPPCTLLDLGTGTGIVAIEGAARGHTVVATDLYETALKLARFNAALNGLQSRIDFRRGHQLEPVAGERFALILTAPHYTRVADQLRLEVLRAAPAHVAPGGKLVVATFLDWEGDAMPPVVELILQPLVAEGRDVHVAPLLANVKREWFTVPRSETPVKGLVSRHRFLITIGDARATADDRAPGTLTVVRPSATEVLRQDYVPLSRLRLSATLRLGLATDRRAPISTLETNEDIETLRGLLMALRGGVVSLDGEVSDRVLDLCRFGHSPCVTSDVVSGAAGAILDAQGKVRPCTHGQPLGDFTDTLEQTMNRLRVAAAQAEKRRDCRSCSAEPICSRCLNPYPFDEATYCDFMRTHAREIPLLRRLYATLLRLGSLALPVRIKLRRAAPLVAAHGRPHIWADDAPSGPEGLVQALAARWQQQQTWIINQGGQRHALFWLAAGDLRGVACDPLTAAIGELIGDGTSAAQIGQYLRTSFVPPAHGDRVLEQLVTWFSEDQNRQAVSVSHG